MIDATLDKINRIIPQKWQWVLNHEGFRKYFKNTGWMFFGRIFSLVISFFVGAYIARYLGPSNFGLMNYVISFVGLFGFLASFGVDNVVGREIIKNFDSKDKIIGTSFYIKLFGALLAIISIFIISIFTTNDRFTLLLIWLFSLSYIPQTFNIIEIYFQTQVLSKKVVKAQMAASFISAILKVLCILFNKGIFWLLSVYIFEVVLVSLFLIISFKYSKNYFRNLKFDIKCAKSIMKDSWPLMISTVAIGVYMKIDQVMIKNMLGNEQAGMYAAVVKISEVWYFIPSMICASIFPAIINARSVNLALYKHRLSRLYKLMFWMSFFIALPISLFAKNIIFLIFGGEYVAASLVLSIYVWAGISVSLGIVVSYYLLAENYPYISMITTFLGALLNILMNFLLLPKLGIVGAAVSTLVAYSFVFLSVGFFKQSRYQILLFLKSIL